MPASRSLACMSPSQPFSLHRRYVIISVIMVSKRWLASTCGRALLAVGLCNACSGGNGCDRHVLLDGGCSLAVAELLVLYTQTGLAICLRGMRLRPSVGMTGLAVRIVSMLGMQHCSAAALACQNMRLAGRLHAHAPLSSRQ